MASPKDYIKTKVSSIPTQTLVIAGLVIVLLFVLLFRGGGGDTSKYDEQIKQAKYTVDSLNTLIEANSQTISTANKHIAVLEDSLKASNTRILLGQIKLNNLKKEYDKKNKSIVKLNVSDIELYFTNRYPSR